MNDNVYGFNIYSKPIEELLDYAIQHNLKHIEIHPSKTHSSVESFTNERIKKLLKITQQNQISLSIHIPHNLNIADIILPIRRKHIAQLKSFIDLASKINAQYITLHIGSFYWFPMERKMRTNALNRFAKNIKPILKICEEKNIKIALENSVPIPHGSDYYFLGDNVKDFEFLFNELDFENIVFCLDTGHANIAEGIEEYIHKFGHKIVTIHYHDNNKKNDEHLPIGKGAVNWKNFSNLMKEINFKGPYVSECREQLPHESAILLKSIL